MRGVARSFPFLETLRFFCGNPKSDAEVLVAQGSLFNPAAFGPLNTKLARYDPIFDVYGHLVLSVDRMVMWRLMLAVEHRYHDPQESTNFWQARFALYPPQFQLTLRFSILAIASKG
jgi:hypothetical protein